LATEQSCWLTPAPWATLARHLYVEAVRIGGWDERTIFLWIQINRFIDLSNCGAHKDDKGMGSGRVTFFAKE
jgi:hypothetical protein